jgi:nitroreductase
MKIEHLERLIRTRRSIRRWKEKPVAEDLLLKAIELATWAPNGGNRQNWRFMVITNQGLIGQIADVVQSKLDMIVSWPEASRFGDAAERWKSNGAYFRNAPSCVAVLMAKYASEVDQILELRTNRDGSVKSLVEARRLTNAGLQSVAAAIAYFLLALHSEGLGGVWMTGPLLAKGQIESLLQVPKEMNLVALIPVGYPDESPTKTRKPVSEVVTFYR